MRKFLSFLIGVIVGLAAFVGLKYLADSAFDFDFGLLVISSMFPLMACLFVVEYDTRMGFDSRRTVLVSTLGLPLLILIIGVLSTVMHAIMNPGISSNITLVEAIVFLVAMAIVGLVSGCTYAFVSKIYMRVIK